MGLARHLRAFRLVIVAGLGPAACAPMVITPTDHHHTPRCATTGPDRVL
jgi:hypothetical protein